MRVKFIYSQCLCINVVYEHSRYIVHTDSKCNESVHPCLWLIAQLRSYYFVNVYVCGCVCVVWVGGCMYALVNKKKWTWILK